jgi:acyl-CoA reductase-like NAD-dependent aldehyde dehydrogenase
MQHCPEDARISNEEIFGPILPIVEFDEVSEAIAAVNQKPKPLALYIFSQDKSFQQEIVTQTSSGAVCINDANVHLSRADLPFGGVGNSGHGRYHGKAGFETFSNKKSIFRQTSLFDIPKRYPPSDAVGLRMIRKLIK